MILKRKKGDSVTRLWILVWNKMEGEVYGQVLNKIEHHNSVRTVAEVLKSRIHLSCKKKSTESNIHKRTI